MLGAIAGAAEWDIQASCVHGRRDHAGPARRPEEPGRTQVGVDYDARKLQIAVAAGTRCMPVSVLVVLDLEDRCGLKGCSVGEGEV